MLNFIKMHGLGNDFVILDGRKVLPALNPERIRLICDRNRGVGCDQLIVMEAPSTDVQADVFMRIYNPDASEAGACGNATRCVADILMAEAGRDSVVIQTVAGLLACTRADDGLITVDMGTPKTEWQDIPLARAMDTLDIPAGPGGGVGVNMGNPHCVFFCEEAEDIPVDRLGKAVETDPLFPARTNVEFVSMRGPDHLRMRVWERGAGITQACGSGACAVAVAAVRRGLTGRRVRISLDGGDLWVEWRENDGHVLMTGPVSYVFTGVFSDMVAKV